MKSKKLIYKTNYENISSSEEIPNPTIEDIRDILLEINKGIVWGTTMLPYDIKYEIRDFDVNFNNVLKQTRKDITFLYKYKYVIEDPNRPKYTSKIIGYRLGTDVQKVDIVSFFTKVKENTTEHRIYQIGGRYSSSSELLDDFKQKIEQEIQGYSTAQIIQYYEQIKSSPQFNNFNYAIKHYILKTLESLYFSNKNKAKSNQMFEEIMGLRFMEDLEIEQIVEEKPILLTENEIKNNYEYTIKYFLDFAKDNLPEGIINDLQKEVVHSDILSNEGDIFTYSVKMIEETENSLIIISNEFVLNLLQSLNEYAYQKNYAKFLYLTSADMKTYEGLIKSMSALGNIKIDSVKFEPVIYFILRDFKEIVLGKDNKSCIIIKDETLIKKLLVLVENVLKLEKPFNLLLKESLPELDERILDKEQESITHFLYTAMFKNIYSKDNLPITTVEEIIDILINNPTVELRLPNVLDYEEKKHPVRFRDALENTRMDLTIYYAFIPDGFESGEFGIVQVDIVSFFTKSKNLYQYTEHRIYQIGDKRLIEDEPTFNTIFNLAELYYENKNVDMAIKLYEILLEEYPDNPNIKDQLEKLSTE